MSPTRTLVLFSGGRDSSATAALMARKGFLVKLFTYQAGLPELVGPHGDSAPDIRHKELLTAFPSAIDPERAMSGSTYLIRKLALEKTNTMHVVYPLALILAVQAEAIGYCLRHNITDIACGYSGYQAVHDRYIEQRADFADKMRALLKDYHITLHTPIISYNKEEVIDVLEQSGISSNSLENKSLFGGIPFEVEHAEHFWETSLPQFHEFIRGRTAVQHT